MSESPARDLLVGVFVLAGLAAIAYLSVALGGASYRGRGGLEVVARFDQIGGLKPRSQVVVGGVKIGQVRAISLDGDLRPLVVLDIDDRLQLPTDTSASILTSGVLGDQ
jgi:phospholipid/cholesterol/gamma-HCH transport system substrate-binding protein